MRISTAFPSKYLKATELEGDATYTMSHVEMETLGEGKDADTKPVIYFHEVDKGLACNRTNANTIAGLYGDDTDQWTGKAITLFATEVDFAGKQTLAIRVRMKKPAAAGSVGPLHNVGAAAAQGGYDEARRAFDVRVEQHNTDYPEDAYKDGEAATLWRKIMGDLFPGRTAKSLSAAEWGSAKDDIENNFDAATRSLLPF